MDTAPQNEPNGNEQKLVVDILPKKDDVQDNKDIAAISYLLPLSVLVYFLKKDSPFVTFHSRQGMVLFGVSIVAWFMPVFGRVFQLVVLIGVGIGFFGAAQGHWTDVPVVGPVSRGDWKGTRTSWQQLIDIVLTFARRVINWVKGKDAKKL